MRITSIDHLVLASTDVPRTIDFYSGVLGLEPREERPGKWALHFGNQKISLQDVASIPDIASQTTPGSANFCLLTNTPLDQVVERLEQRGVTILEGPARKLGATGPIYSVYFHDPDGNLVEVSNREITADN